MIDKDWFQGIEVRINEPMSKHTTFEIGGPCDAMVFPKTVEEMVRVMRIVQDKDLNYRIIGHGSNLLVRDKGLRELVIKLDENFSKISMENGLLTAQAGVFMKDLSNVALDHGLTGLEALSGIPGNVGGLMTMNAGAYGTEMKDVVEEVVVLTEDLEIKTLSVEEMHLSYRHSRVHEDRIIVLAVRFNLLKDDKEKIKERVLDYKNRREEKQPLDFPSAGSTFKRPEGYYAAKLIDDSGLRGARKGGAMVSQKHCGFVINYDQATSQDVLDLIDYIKKVVYEKHQVRLETEVKIIGE